MSLYKTKKKKEKPLHYLLNFQSPKPKETNLE